MSDARWFEVDADMDAAVRHFERSIELFRKGDFDVPGLDGFRVHEAARTIEAAATLANKLRADILAFRSIIDPPEDKLAK